jgi:oligoribonuclease (3'-5' exoribonuclease)
MPYVSIDIETTGLDPETCQTLEVGAVIDDWKSPINQLPTFRRILMHEQIVGTPFALALNAGLLKQIAADHGPDDPFCQPKELGYLLADWVKCYGLDPMDLQAAGKNFASFDMLFLKRLPNFNTFVKFRHRVLDPAILYYQPADGKLPDSKTCYERAGLDAKVAHTAVEDALAVVWLVRYGIKKLEGMKP